MTSALINLGGATGASSLAADLASVGIKVIGQTANRNQMVQNVVRDAPDVVVYDDPAPGEELFQTAQAIGQVAPVPVIVFTTDTDAEKIGRATRCGIHAYVINGYGLHRLRSVIHLAQARFKHEQLLQEELQDISGRFEERKLVDRAKGILMRARQVSEDDAFQVLRTASMHANLRLGQVSQQVISSARFAEAVNTAGQLRMLSQRLAKLYFLQLTDARSAQHSQLLADSAQRIDTNLAILKKSVSQATFGDLLAQVGASWAALQTAVHAAPQASQIAAVDILAENLLHHTETLTTGLENALSASPLHVINVSGRQRMLSQRFAKYALLEAVGNRAGAAQAQAGRQTALREFELAMLYLHDIPLGNRVTRDGLAAAQALWCQLVDGAGEIDRPAGRLQVAASSERLLDLFEQLTLEYERSMQMLVG